LARQRLRAYLAAGVTFFLDLTHPGELAPYETLLQDEAALLDKAVKYQRMSIRDFSIPTVEHMRAVLETLDGALASGHNVYVHCWGGIGRTGTVVGCYLVRRGLSGEDALAQLAQWWGTVAKAPIYPRSPQTDEQVEFVRQWRPHDHL
jgi:hypothetical protein